MVTKEMCDYCGDEESIRNCNDCQKEICGQHSHECEACLENYCPECIHKCEDCEGYVCNECRVECFTCKEHSLHKACAHKVGNNYYCEGHSQECTACYTRLPTDDLVICVKCEETVCGEHRVQVDTEIFCNECAGELEDG